MQVTAKSLGSCQKATKNLNFIYLAPNVRNIYMRYIKQAAMKTDA
jgi:hypothetical protein